ncbi:MULTISPECIES: RHS repeat-associated core domain-containing protein [unclassified Pseudomonas]|uniref:RHS repeat-associated core domain-containing protein n=1 Tax=unclassified Pseudomonas TaxID=196821 RepID=UPI000A1FD30C|nr:MULTISPECIES: RHS repeat-associated core domain-containing protein [unclassified Pseudomonas]
MFKIRSYTPYGFYWAFRGSLVGFNGERRDTMTGCDFLGVGRRIYSPVLMRFCSEDGLSPFYEGGLNAYAYCEADPVNYSDPSAMARWSTIVREKVLASGRRADLKRKLPLQEHPIDYSLRSATSATSASSTGSAGFTGSTSSAKRTHVGRVNKIYRTSDPRSTSSDFWVKMNSDYSDYNQLASDMVDTYNAKAGNSQRGVPPTVLTSAIEYKIKTGGGNLSKWEGLSQYKKSNQYKNERTAMAALHNNINRVARLANELRAE